MPEARNDATTGSRANASPVVDSALSIAAQGWHVFPVSSGKTPILRAGFTVSFRPAVAPWAEHLVQPPREGGTQWGMERGAAYWATRDERLIRTLFGAAASLGRGVMVGVTSDLLCIDVDHPERVPDAWAPLLAGLPSYATPSGGRHYFAALPPGLDFQVGAFRLPNGDGIGDLKHLAGKGYSVAYPGLPDYGDCAGSPLPVVLGGGLREARAVRAGRPSPAAAAARTGGGVSLDPRNFTGAEPPPTPLDLFQMAEGDGCHDTLISGTMADAARGLSRADEWYAALVNTGRDPARARTEVDDAVQGAERRIAEEQAAGDPTLRRAAPVQQEAGRQEPAPAFGGPPTDTPEGCAEAIAEVADVFRALPVGKEFVDWRDGGMCELLAVGNRADSRLVLTVERRVRDRQGKPFELPRRRDRRQALYHEIGRANERRRADLSDEGLSMIDAAILSLLPDPVPAKQVLMASKILHTTQSAGQAGADDARVKRRLHAFGWRPNENALRRYQVWVRASGQNETAGERPAGGGANLRGVDGAGGYWHVRQGQTRLRCWMPPDGWRRCVAAFDRGGEEIPV